MGDRDVHNTDGRPRNYATKRGCHAYAVFMFRVGRSSAACLIHAEGSYGGLDGLDLGAHRVVRDEHGVFVIVELAQLGSGLVVQHVALHDVAARSLVRRGSIARTRAHATRPPPNRHVTAP
jgi:hypothetical protein